MKLNKFYTVDSGNVQALLFRQKETISSFRHNVVSYLDHCKYFIDDLINKRLTLFCYHYNEEFKIVNKDSVTIYEIKKAALLL